MCMPAGGGGGSPLLLAWSPGNWETAQDGGTSPGHTCPRARSWPPAGAMPAGPFLPHRPMSLRITSHRGNPQCPALFSCPRLSPGPAVAPVLQSAFPSHSAPGTVPSCGQATLTGPLLGLCPQGSSAPTQGEARAFLLAQTQLGPAQGPDLPAPRPSVGSRGPAWPAPRVQPPTLFLKAGPGLGCLMIFSWWSSATLKFHLHGQAGPGLVYWRLAGGLG